eukprot:TRINITY_DN14671_c0_g1_i1.p1 TRINITY_DN14671_c0_g1~~TRINITY_DN14671_c0_g1_i1.p1  ORF type:complete len:211 (+),score=36.98 TRINITY_DN14671_c0_g1_i1:224-856(+)
MFKAMAASLVVEPNNRPGSQVSCSLFSRGLVEEGVDRVLVGIESFENFVKQKLRDPLEVIWYDFFVQCSTYGRSKVRILPDTDLQVIFGDVDGPVHGLLDVARKFLSALECVLKSDQAPIGMLATCVVGFMNGRHFPDYMEGLAQRQANHNPHTLPLTLIANQLIAPTNEIMPTHLRTLAFSIAISYPHPNPNAHPNPSDRRESESASIL